MRHLWRRFCFFHAENRLGSTILIYLNTFLICTLLFTSGVLSFILTMGISLATAHTVESLVREEIKIMLAESYGIPREQLEEFLQKKFDKGEGDGSKSP